MLPTHRSARWQGRRLRPRTYAVLVLWGGEEKENDERARARRAPDPALGPSFNCE